MYLSALEVWNFKPFEHARIELPASGLSLVIGPNNIGKTALLSAFDVPGASANQIRRFGAAEPARLQATFRLSDADRSSCVQATDPALDSAAILQTHALETVSMHYEENESGQVRLTLVGGSGPGGELVDIGRLAWHQPLAQDQIESIQFGEAFLNLDSQHWHPSYTQNGQFESLDAAVALRPLLDLIAARWRNRVYKFDVHRLGTQHRRPTAGAALLAPTGDNAPEVLLHLLANDKPHYDEIGDVMADVVPELGRLATPIEGSQVWIEFVDEASGRRTNLVDAGTGVQQILLAALVGSSAAANHSLVLLEEPELHLHPGAQRRLIAHLERWSSNVSIVVSTHSTVFLDAFASSGNVWEVGRKEGKTAVRNAVDALPEVLSNLGVRAADVLGSDGLLIVEGASDLAILKIWVPQLNERNIAVQVAGGGDRARQADVLAEWFAATDTLTRPVMFLRDHDELSDADLNKLEATGRVAVLERREIENYLLEPDAICAHLATRGVVVDGSEIEGLIDEACAALVQEVILKRVAARLPLVRQLDRAKVREIVQEGVSKAAALTAVAATLSNDDIVSRVSDLWDEQQAAVEGDWPTMQRALAPGADVLARVWSNFHLSFDKVAEGPALAALVNPPAEIIERLVNAFGW